MYWLQDIAMSLFNRRLHRKKYGACVIGTYNSMKIFTYQMQRAMPLILSRSGSLASAGLGPV
jgi:hypothetical protein